MKTPIRSVLPLLIFLYLAPVTSTLQAVLPPPDGGYPGFNTAEGQNALFSLTTGVANTAVGWFSLFSDTGGSFNTAVGAGALLSNVGGPTEGAGAVENTAVGAAALLFNTQGAANTAVGTAALLNNNGSVNTAIGSRALTQNTGGSFNTAVGTDALANNTTAEQNTAVGFGALGNDVPGSSNTAVGSLALQNTTGSENTACGQAALANSTTGNNNTAVGRSALFNTTGSANTACGRTALANNTTGSQNTAVGEGALANSTGNLNTALGEDAGINVTNASNVIAIGEAADNVSNSCFIGHIRAVATAQNNAIPVLIDSSGQLGTVSSSRRYKKEIKSMDKTSEAILALKPVTFHYKSDSTNRPEFGLIAEEVAEINPDLVVRDENGETYTVRYDAVNAMLLNEFLKEHRKVEELEATVAALAATVKEQASRLERVSAQVQMNDPAAQVAANDH
jgi:hypothetical protein